MVDAIALELMCVGCAEDLVPSYLGCDDLADDIAVGEADDKAVLGSVVFVLGLADETFTSVVVGFTGTATLVFDLIAAAGTLVVLVGGMGRAGWKSMVIVAEKARGLYKRYSPKVRTILDQLGERLHTNPRVSNLRFSQCPKLLAVTLDKRCHVGLLTGCGLGQLNLPWWLSAFVLYCTGIIVDSNCTISFFVGLS